MKLQEKVICLLTCHVQMLSLLNRNKESQEFHLFFLIILKPTTFTMIHDIYY